MNGIRWLTFLVISFCWMGILTTTFAQKEANTWLFGRKAGLRFSTNEVIPFYGSAMSQIEGTAVLSDKRTGELLFYSDGMSVWNRLHQLMPNGQGLAGSQTSTQSALIVPLPGKQGLFYLFTVKAYNENNNQGGLYYSIVDLSQHNGLGDIIRSQKNILLESYTTEKLTAIPHANGRDYWILSHAWNNNEFIIYALTPTGLSTQKKTAIGTVHKAGMVGGSEAMGYLKASPNGKFLASAVYGEARPFELYNFNNQTGTISNYRSLGNFLEQYGVSFSSDNSKLYLSGISPTSGSYQFDLSDNKYQATELTVVDTVAEIPQKSFIAGALQLGIDGKLYSSSDEGKMSVINYPNAKGVACDAHYIHFNFNGGRPQLGLPNYIQTIFDSTADTTSHPVDPDTTLESDCSQALKVYPNPIIDNYVHVEINSTTCPFKGLKVYDLSGRLIAEFTLSVERSFKIDVSRWMGGGQVYLFLFVTDTRTIVRKVIKW